MNCPECKSSNTQKFRIAHESGTDDFTLNQTKLAKKCEPPKEPFLDVLFGYINGIASVIVALVVGFKLGSFWLGIIALGASFIGLKVFWSSTLGAGTAKQYENELSDWDKSWVCIKCGHEYLE